MEDRRIFLALKHAVDSNDNPSKPNVLVAISLEADDQSPRVRDDISRFQPPAHTRCKTFMGRTSMSNPELDPYLRLRDSNAQSRARLLSESIKR